jgi:hypothetical protein
MVRWHYRLTALWATGILLAVFAFAAVAGCALLQSAAEARGVGLRLALPGAFLVRHPDAPPPSASLAPGSGRLSPPLADGRACLELLRGHPQVGSVLPFSLGAIVLKHEEPDHRIIAPVCAIALPDDAWRVVRSRLSAGAVGLPDTLSGGVVLGEEVLAESEVLTRRSGGVTIFMDRPAATDRFNLTAVRLAGSFIFPGEQSPGLEAGLCFTAPERLLRATWLSLGEIAPVIQAPPSPRPAPMPLSDKTPAGAPLGYPFLFTLRTAGRLKMEAPPEPLPTYLLIILAHDEPAIREQTLGELKQAFAARGLAAVIEPWDPSGAGAIGSQATGLVMLAAFFIMLTAFANAALRPVLSEVQPEPGPAPFGRRHWRPSFFGSSARLALASGAIGAVGAFALIALYNFFGPGDIKNYLAGLLSVRLETIVFPGIGLALAGAGMALFALLSTIVPRRRADRIIRILTADPAPSALPDDDEPPTPPVPPV